MGDFNAASHHWGSNSNNDRGRAILRFAEDYQLAVLNDGAATRIDYSTGITSAIGLTLVSLEMANKFRWSVDVDNYGSDHFPTYLTLHNATLSREAPRRPRWLYNEADWGLFQCILDEKLNDTVNNVNSFTAAVIDAAFQSIPRKSGHPSVKEAVKSRRKALRKLRRMNMDNPNRMAALDDFSNIRKIARKTILDVKSKSWNEFLNGFNPNLHSRSLWQKVHTLCGVRKERKMRLLSNDIVITNADDLAEIVF